MKYEDRNLGVSYAKNPFKRCKTTRKCEKCGKYLCCNAKNMCFNEYHSKVSLNRNDYQFESIT